MLYGQLRLPRALLRVSKASRAWFTLNTDSEAALQNGGVLPHTGAETGESSALPNPLL